MCVKNEIDKRSIKFEKRNADPEYFSQTIHTNFVRLQGQPFNLFYMERDKPDLKALPPDINNVVALLNYEQLKRSHIYVKPVVCYKQLKRSHIYINKYVKPLVCYKQLKRSHIYVKLMFCRKQLR